MEVRSISILAHSMAGIVKEIVAGGVEGLIVGFAKACSVNNDSDNEMTSMMATAM